MHHREQQRTPPGALETFCDPRAASLQKYVQTLGYFNGSGVNWWTSLEVDINSSVLWSATRPAASQQLQSVCLSVMAHVSRSWAELS